MGSYYIKPYLKVYEDNVESIFINMGIILNLWIYARLKPLSDKEFFGHTIM